MHWLGVTLAVASLAHAEEVYYDLVIEDMYVNFWRPTIDLEPPAHRQTFEEIDPTAIRYVQLINNQYPGPLIEAFEHDTLVIHIQNELRHGIISMHWHGLHQRGTPYMDGMYMFTECGILPKTNFTYEFEAYPAGTRLAHGHAGNQFELGLMMPVVIHREVEPHGGLYDGSRVITITDWWRYPAELVDEVGTFASADDSYNMRYMTTLLNGQWGNGTESYPWPLIEVEQGLCYRFRIIDMASQMPGYRFSVWGHTLTAIALDGNDIVPREVNDVAVYAGDRVDVVFCANQEIGNYRILLREHGNHQVEMGVYPAYGYIHYVGAELPGTDYGPAPDPYMPEFTDGLDFLDTMKNPSADKMLELEELPDATPGYEFTFDLGSLVSSDELNHAFWYSFIDHVPFTWPQAPLLHEPSSCGKPRNDVALTIKDLGAVLEIVFNNLVDIPHPMHIHGHDMWILGTGYLPNGMNEPGNMAHWQDCPTTAVWADPEWTGFKYQRYWGCIYDPELDGARLNRIDPIRKDSVTVPARTWAVVRFVADNPGVWAFHCHTLIHDMLGMMMAFDVAPGHPTRELPPHFPVCGSCARDNLLKAQDDLAAALDERDQLQQQLALLEAKHEGTSMATESTGGAETSSTTSSAGSGSWSMGAVIMLPTGVVLLAAVIAVAKNRWQDDGYAPVEG